MTTMPVNNDMYRSLGHAWWNDDVGEFSTIRFWINPVRFGYFQRMLNEERMLDRGKRKLLDVGCGGGFLAEEFAGIGLEVTGIDPAPETIDTARTHAAASGLSIEYATGSGEHLPFPGESFDIVACCDVLEHVDDVDRVIGEIARVLKPGGLFLYDTINRTFRSKLTLIKIMQDWRSTAISAALNGQGHVWERFIKPPELINFLDRHGLKQKGMRGISTRRNAIAVFLDFRRRVKGQISFRELGQRLALRESDDLSVSYMGSAVKICENKG